MKLGVAFLYGEGGRLWLPVAFGLVSHPLALSLFPLFFSHPLPCVTHSPHPPDPSFPRTVVANVEKAASALSCVEAMSGLSKPFVWLLFRPPWSSEICSKACIFKRLLEMADDPEEDPLLPLATPRARQLHRGRLLYAAGKTMALAVSMGAGRQRMANLRGGPCRAPRRLQCLDRVAFPPSPTPHPAGSAHF